jgi:hypothetical protein
MPKTHIIRKDPGFKTKASKMPKAKIAAFEKVNMKPALEKPDFKGI